MPDCECGKWFPPESSLHFNTVRSRNRVFKKNLGSHRNKRHKKTGEPDFNAAHLPPSIGGTGNNRSVDNVFLAPSKSTGEVYPEDRSAAGSQIDEAHAPDVDDCENFNEESALGIADATDDQLIDVFCHLLSKPRVKRARH